MTLGVVTWQVTQGAVKVWRDGQLVAEIPARQFPHLMLDLAKALRDAAA